MSCFLVDHYVDLSSLPGSARCGPQARRVANDMVQHTMEEEYEGRMLGPSLSCQMNPIWQSAEAENTGKPLEA